MCLVNLTRMENQIAENLRTLWDNQNLSLRHATTVLEIDTAQLSIIEKGIRLLKRKQIPTVAKILEANGEGVMTLWMADQFYAVVKDENLADDAWKMIERNINLGRNKIK